MAILLQIGLLTPAWSEDLKVYAEPGGLHVVAADLITTASYRVAVWDGETTQTIALGGDGEAWAFPTDPTPRLLSVTLLRGGKPILSATSATGDPALLIDDAVTSVVLAALASQRAAVLGGLKGANRTAAEAAFDKVKVDLLGLRRAAGRDRYFEAARAAQVESSKDADRTRRKIESGIEARP